MGRLITFQGCEPCSLRKEWKWLAHPQMPIAAPSENSDYRIVVVGEAPGETEDNEGIPFVGKTGRFLREQIPTEWRKKLYWSNTVRCHPPKNRKPIPEEIQCCSVYQERDLLSIKPHAILAVGDYALKYFWPTAWVTGMRGVPFPVQLNDGSTTWCTSIFHPRYVMESERKDYDTKETVNAALPVYKNDITNFFDKLPYFAANPPTIYSPPKDIIYPKTEEEVYSLFDKLSDPYGHDIETFKLKPYKRDGRILTAAFSDGKLTFAFPVNWPGNINNWGQRAYNTIMTRGSKTWIAQHAGFEYIWIWSSTGTHKHKFEDIEVLARLYHKRAGLGSLNNLSRIYLGLDIKTVTNLDKNRLLDYPIENVLEYNALDAWSTYCIFQILMSKVSDIDLENYIRLIETCKSVVASEINGLHVDISESEKIERDLFTKIHKFEEQAKLIPEVKEYEKRENKIFQLSAPEQIGHVLVMYCGLQLPKTEKQTQYSTDETDLSPLAGKHQLVDLTLDFREIQKLKSTYVDPILLGTILGADNLLHPSYTTVHTRTYRLSSEDPNIQNFPKRKNKYIRKQLVAKPGHIFAAFDYGQLEARGLCMYSRDKNLTYYMTEQAKAIALGDKKLIEKYDIHYKWLYKIIDVYPHYMDRLAKNSGETEEKAILKAGRTIIKTDWVFASFYGSQAPSLSSRTNIPIEIVKEILSEFWGEKEGYREVKRWIDEQFILYQREGEVRSLTGRARNEVLPGNEVINTPCQGLAAEIVTEAQNALCKMALEIDPYFLPRVNIHDDLLFELPDSNDLFQYIQTIGQEIVKPRFPFINVPLMTECRIGTDWASLESVVNFVGEPYSEINVSPSHN